MLYEVITGCSIIFDLRIASIGVKRNCIFRITSYNVCYTKLLRTLFAATFIGENNILSEDGRLFAVRPEKLRGTHDLDGAMRTGEIVDVQYLGSIHKVIVQLDEEPMTVSIVLDSVV